MCRSRKAGPVEPPFSRSGSSFSLEISCHKSLQSDLSKSTTYVPIAALRLCSALLSPRFMCVDDPCPNSELLYVGVQFLSC